MFVEALENARPLAVDAGDTVLGVVSEPIFDALTGYCGR